jgi:hypothetical protein
MPSRWRPTDPAALINVLHCGQGMAHGTDAEPSKTMNVRTLSQNCRGTANLRKKGPQPDNIKIGSHEHFGRKSKIKAP